MGMLNSPIGFDSFIGIFGKDLAEITTIFRTCSYTEYDRIYFIISIEASAFPG